MTATLPAVPVLLVCAMALVAPARNRLVDALPAGAPEQLDSGQVRLRLALAGNEVRYLVNEQLAGRPLRNDAVGVTSAVSGQLLIDGSGRFVVDSSSVTIDLASLRTDQERRDNFVRRRTLEVEQFPTAVLRPRELRGLPWPLPRSGEKSFQLVGDLTLHGVTKPTVWAVTAQFAGERISGQARTSVKFGDFGLEIPRLAFVLSVQDSIRLEYDFAFER